MDLTGTPPWSFYYSNGISTWFVPAQNTTPFTIVASEPGVYTVLAVSDANCTGTAAGVAVVAVFPVPPAPVISINGTELNSTGCCGNQWYENGNLLQGATGQAFIPQESGDYSDIVTVNGCASGISNTISYVVTGIMNHVKNNAYALDPNPAGNFFRVRAGQGTAPAEDIKIYTVTGKLVAAWLPDPAEKDKAPLIDVQRLSPGLYFVAIGTASRKTILKLVVQ